MHSKGYQSVGRDRASALALAAIDDVWTGAARALGFDLQRSRDCYAATDGAGRILIGAPEILDVDDSFAQLVFHELCHALVQGPQRRWLPDWGLDVSGGADTAREHACLRVQAFLARPFGLRALMAPTTEYRGYYDALPEDAFGGANDPAAEIARAAVVCDPSDASRASPTSTAHWLSTLRQALAATTALVGDGAVARHPLGFALGPPAETCGSCAWLYVGGRGHAVERCRQKNFLVPGSESSSRTQRDFAACEKWEPPVRCEACGACCREAYHVVSVSMRDPVVWKQPQLIVRRGHRFEILRDGDRCAALDVDATAPASSGYRCRIYDDRPATCREFAAGGPHCLQARQRVGKSR